jgi:hypothetical protein
MHDAVPEIAHAERLIDLFGHWPDFHDAEVRALRLDATDPAAPFLEADVDIDEPARGYEYPARARCRTTLRFGNASQIAVTEFRGQNVLDELNIRRLDPAEAERLAYPWPAGHLQVEFIPVPGFCAVNFLCDTAEVVHATLLPAAT